MANNVLARIWSKGGTSFITAATAKSLQSCPTLCDPIDSSPPGSPDPGILRARTLEWVAISFSNAWKWKVKEKLLSRVRLFETTWTAAHQAPPSMGFCRQEYWSGMPLHSLLVECKSIWFYNHIEQLLTLSTKVEERLFGQETPFLTEMYLHIYIENLLWKYSYEHYS